MSLIKNLENWYVHQCDGNWEHIYGIKIETLDNPGWMVKIDLTDTDLESKNFDRLEIERNENNWIHCWIKDNVFEGAGGPKNLSEIIEVFLNWVKGA